MDESTVVLQPYPTYGWAAKGSRAAVLFNHTRKKFHMIGAQGIRSFYCKFADRVTQKEVVEFLKDLVKKRRKVSILLDNAKWHKSKIVKAYAQEHKLKLVFFLPYTPELNPIETRWREIKKELGNKLFYDIEEMKDIVSEKIVQKGFFMNKFYHYLCP